MKKLFLYFLSSLLLVGCSEEKKTDSIRKASKYLKADIMKELSKLDEINMDKMINNSIEGSGGSITLLMLFYTSIGTTLTYCEAIAGINKEMDEKNKDPDLKINDDECKIYTEIYEKYNSMYLKAINSNSIPKYYFFELKYPIEANQESVGIFPTKKECEYYANLFREKNIGLTSSCKKGFSQN